MDKISTLEQFYEETRSFVPEDIGREIGHFNVFKIDELMAASKGKPVMPYNRRAYYKISLIRGRNRAEYADKTIEIEKNALLFATPKVPYHYVPEDEDQSGSFCIFTGDYLAKDKSGIQLDDLPLFAPGGYPVFQLSEEQAEEIDAIFQKMHRELASDYIYKYDLLRNYTLELIHYGQKLQPMSATHSTQNASTRITSLFVELLERQFPIESPRQRLQMRTAAAYADRLAVHVNHLNQVLKETTGKTTSAIISGRIIKEAKILLKQTDWNVSEIAFALGFGEVAHFSNFFKKHTSFTPVAFRQ
ncbi:helix-turn-helix domain-containing protein [Flavilitoribacter nigricans]|uniref:AraC family transcriptional regulator n=1 Tax=Flavilitoribacter nigricans (strain ATCC 23147 / DSM 23189 / NBRC 102662 / NCIMB 1420 / SS-2) TaxID=1122177 RepID=A0A2D0MXT4_FLAN2|nr:AraC family transcriptional regulator [Flavilitoribacter nigricans]PHN01091.1 AraC family transcriptional regulator [Flavilitoribacter nigricans DSM 23189 = NBRC 102662]